MHLLHQTETRVNASNTANQDSTQPQCNKKRDLGLPADAFEVPTTDNCCVHCESLKSRPNSVPAYGSRMSRPRSRALEPEEIIELESLSTQTVASMASNRGHRILEVVEEERTPLTTPSPSTYLPDIHHNQKVL